MLKELPPPTKAAEYRNTGEILRELAAQLRFSDSRAALIMLAEHLDRFVIRHATARPAGTAYLPRTEGRDPTLVCISSSRSPGSFFRSVGPGYQAREFA